MAEVAVMAKMAEVAEVAEVAMVANSGESFPHAEASAQLRGGRVARHELS